MGRSAFGARAPTCALACALAACGTDGGGTGAPTRFQAGYAEAFRREICDDLDALFDPAGEDLLPATGEGA